MPYTSEGPKEITVASWNKLRGLQISTEHHIFSEKYSNFYGAVVNVTSLPYPPYWLEEEYTTEDGTKEIRISGTDGNLLHAVSQSLNFTFFNIPTNDWDEVVERIIDRESFISPVLWTILPERLARFDMTYVYTWTAMAFCKAKPSGNSNWESLKNPLSNSVWLGILVCVITAPGILYAIVSTNRKLASDKSMGFGLIVLEIFGTLLGQNFKTRLPKADSGRLMMVAWLIFTFIIGAAYRGNLTAHLTLPSFPTRPESVEDLVNAVDVVTGASYISYFKEFFSKSEYPPFKKFGDLMIIGPNAPEGMQRASKNSRSALMDIRMYLESLIATEFTKPDGSTDLYIGKSSLLPGQAGWPIPHDAPFKSNLDKSMQFVIEAGLYEKWNSDIMEKSRRESMKKQLDFLAGDESLPATGGSADLSSSSEDQMLSLTVDHMKAPIFFFIGGLILSVLSFGFEYVYGLTTSSVSKRQNA